MQQYRNTKIITFRCTISWFDFLFLLHVSIYSNMRIYIAFLQHTASSNNDTSTAYYFHFLSTIFQEESHSSIEEESYNDDDGGGDTEGALAASSTGTNGSGGSGGHPQIAGGTLPIRQITSARSVHNAQYNQLFNICLFFIIHQFVVGFLLCCSYMCVAFHHFFL